MSTARQPKSPKRKRRWFQYSLRSLMIFVTLLAAWLGWRNYLERARLADEADAREVVYREIFDRWRADNGPRNTANTYVAFISFGSIDSVRYIDPPVGYLERFRDVPLAIRPASLAKILESSEVEPGVFESHVSDPQTGRWGCILNVTIIGWIGDDTIHIMVDEYVGPLSGKGFSGVMKKIDGRWQITERKGEWVS